MPVVEPSQASMVTQQGQKGTHKGDARHKAENTPDPTAVGVWVEQMRRNRRSMSLFYRAALRYAVFGCIQRTALSALAVGVGLTQYE